MEARENKVRPTRKRLLWAAAILILFAVIAVIGGHQRQGSVTPNPIFLEKLQSAKHFRSSFPAQAYARQVIRESSLQPESLKNAAMNAIGMELREVGDMATGDSE